MTDGAQWGPPPPAGHGGPAQPGYGQPPHGWSADHQLPYGPPVPGYPPAGYGQAPYGQAPYGQAPYGWAPYGQPLHGQIPYGPPAGFGGWPPPRRPSVVAAAGIVGIVTGGLTAFGSLLVLLAAAAGEDDVSTVLLTLGLPCAVGLITGGVRVLQGRASRLLFVSALAAVGVLLAALVASMLTMSATDRFGVTAFVAFAAVPPIVTAVLARLRQVTAWVGG